jgi:hypothetical protein
MMTWFNFFILIKEQLRSDKKEIEPHHASNEKAYSHSNLDLTPEKECTQDQKIAIYRQLGLNKSIVNVDPCQRTNWLDLFIEEEADRNTVFSQYHYWLQ